MEPITTPELNCDRIAIKRFVLEWKPDADGKMGKVTGVVIASPYDPIENQCAPQEFSLSIQDFIAFAHVMAEKYNNPSYLNVFGLLVGCVDDLQTKELPEDAKKLVQVFQNWGIPRPFTSPTPSPKSTE